MSEGAIGGDQGGGGDPGGGAPGGGGDHGGGGGAPDWGSLISSLPEDLREVPSVKDMDSFEGFVNRHVSLEKKLGTNRVEAPGEGWDEAKWGEFYDAIGAPKEGKDYDFSGFEWTPEELAGNDEPELVSKFRDAAASLRLRPEQAKGVAEFYVGLQRGVMQEHEKARAESREKTEAEFMKAHYAAYGGEDGLKAAQADAQKGAEAIFGDQLDVFRTLEFPDGTGVLDHPRMFDALVNIGKSLDEGGLPGSRGASGVGAEAAASQLRALEADPEKQKALNDRQHPQHQEVVEERMRLTAAARGVGGEDKQLRRQLYAPQGLGDGGKRKGI